MRLVFVDNLLLPEKGDVDAIDVHPHLGLMSLVSVAKIGGHEAAIFDPKLAINRGELGYDASLYERAARRIAELEPAVVGFTTLGCSFIFTLKTARALKRMVPGLPILLGGPHATILHREMIERFDEFDVVVRNEAEETLLPVLDGVVDGDLGELPGVTWRREGEIVINPGAPTVTDLDSLPHLAYEEYPIEELGLEALRIDAGRGCPFHCTFCSTASFFGRSYRLKSPDRLVAELDVLNERYGFTDFKLNHDLFTVNREKVIAFCAAVRDRDYTWGVSARIDCVDEQLLQQMWDAGCRGIYFGIETGSARMQKISQKRLDLDLVQPTLDVTERLGMRTIVSYITGYPEELQADQAASLDMLGDCFRRDREKFTTQLHMLTPEPGTLLYEQLADELEYDGYLTDFNAALLAEDDESVIRGARDIFVTYYYYPGALPRERHIFVVEAYRALRRAGHTILRYALRFFERRFSVLVEELYDWTADKGRDGPLEVETVVAFFAARFGSRHHLTSLLRYALETGPTRKLHPEAAGPELVFDPDAAYVLGPGVHLFRDIHDCASLIERITEDDTGGGSLADADTGDLGDYLALGRGTVDGAIDNFSLTPEALVIAGLFERPCSYRDVCRALAPLTGGEDPEIEFFEELLRIGALQPVEPPAPAPILAAAATARAARHVGA